MNSLFFENFFTKNGFKDAEKIEINEIGEEVLNFIINFLYYLKVDKWIDKITDCDYIVLLLNLWDQWKIKPLVEYLTIKSEIYY